MTKRAVEAESISIRQLRANYGAWGDVVLEGADIIKPAMRRKGENRSWMIVGVLPDVGKFDELMRKRFTQPLTAWLSEAGEEIDSLRDECQSWYDNLPEQFQSGEKGEALTSVVEVLEGVQVPEPTDAFENVMVYHVPTRHDGGAGHGPSRSARLADAVATLEACAEALRNLSEGEVDEDGSVRLERGAEELADEIDSVVSDLGGVDFPGMY